MMQRFVPLETHVWRAPLGLQCLDLVSGRAVTDGIVVVAGQRGATMPPQSAVLSPFSGVYGFRTLPGLRAYEVGERPASDWCPPSTLAGDDTGGSANFVVSVRDTRGRFLPQTLLLCLPREHLLEVPLFSAPTRPPPSGMGTIRGELWDTVADAPAAWAFLTATLGAVTYPAVADARGVFALFVPYAAALPPIVGSPPHSMGPLDGLAWPVTLRVFSAPTTLPATEGDAPPDTHAILRQGAALIHDGPGVSDDAITRAIQFGGDLAVASAGDTRVLITPATAASPP